MVKAHYINAKLAKWLTNVYVYSVNVMFNVMCVINYSLTYDCFIEETLIVDKYSKT